MISQSVVLDARSKTGRKHSTPNRSHLPVVSANLFGKRPSSPPFHPRRGDGDVVNAAALHRSVSPDLLETPSAKHLARSGNVFDIHKSIVVDRCSVFLERRAHGSQRRICGQLAQQKGEVLLIKRNVGVQAADRVIVKIRTRSYPALKAWTFPEKFRSRRSGIRTS